MNNQYTNSTPEQLNFLIHNNAVIITKMLKIINNTSVILKELEPILLSLTIGFLTPFFSNLDKFSGYEYFYIPHFWILLFLGINNFWARKVQKVLATETKGFFEKKLREEKDDHGVTKKDYYETAEKVLNNILVDSHPDFHSKRRVSIYRCMGDNELKQIYRHSSGQYKKDGRIRIPDNEGVVGAAWHGDGKCYFSHGSKIDSDTFIKALEKKITECYNKAQMPKKTGTMKSKCYYALVIKNLHSGVKIAIVVFESTIHEDFNQDQLDTLCQKHQSDLWKYVEVRARLDELLNPLEGKSDG